MNTLTRAYLAAMLVVALCLLHFHHDYDELSTYLPRRLTLITSNASSAPVPFISYTLHRNNSFQNLYTPHYQCTAQKHQLHSAMQDTLNFTTKVSTNLKILFMGDSVGVQNAQSFQEAAGATKRNVLRYAWGNFEGLFVSDTNGGGVVAGWRITDLMQRSRENKPLPNRSGGGWKRKDVHKLLNHSFDNNSETIGTFDVIVIRIPHGWKNLKHFTEEKLNESVTLANELFGVRNVIFLSLPFVNNVKTKDDLKDLQETNSMIKEFARKNHTSVNNILVLDFGRLGDALTKWNGQLIGYDVSTTDYLFERLKCCRRKGFRRAIAQVCAERVERGTDKCGIGNGFSIDGLHWCSESLNGRLNAGTACLIKCMYNTVTTSIRECETDCNNRFMSLRAIDAFDDNNDISPRSASVS